MKWQWKDYTINNEKEKLDQNTIVNYILNESYWGKDRTESQIKESIKNSLCFGLYKNSEMIGFARVITDYAVLYYLCDVFVLKEHRGKGLGKWLIETTINSPHLKNLKGFLNTKDAQDLYRKFGFKDAGNSAMVKTNN
ncbi:MAG: GNAT family N-acetyltransferase [Kosmotoga sp.]|nr:MAG: GNAT family N-acetyltransferase [Kosmotoga sp.]